MRFNTKIVWSGERYGRDDCLVHNGEPMIEFYDPRYQHTPIGQFVSRYYVKTLLKDDSNYNLSLDGGEPEWTVQAVDLMEIKTWLRKICCTELS